MDNIYSWFSEIPIKNSDVPEFFVCLLEGKFSFQSTSTSSPCTRLFPTARSLSVCARRSGSGAMPWCFGCFGYPSPWRVMGIMHVLMINMAMEQYLLIPFLVGWTSIYQLFWCELQGYYWFWHTAIYSGYIVDILWIYFGNMLEVFWDILWTSLGYNLI
jgi:hypothetical protein